MEVKIILSNKLYFKCEDLKTAGELEQGLTYQLESQGVSKYPRFMRRFGNVSKDTYWAPIGNLDFVQERLTELHGKDTTFKLIDKRANVPAVIPKPSFILRNDQQPIVDAFNDSCIINGKPG